VNQVNVNFTVSGQPYKIGIWDATGTGDSPGTLLWESASQISTAGISTLLVNPKVNVNGNFYVGVRQTDTTNIAFGYQSEDPVRTNTFFSASPTGSSTWTDFAISGNPFRFMIEPGLTLPSDIVETEIASPKDFELSQNYPNPFNPTTKIDYQLPVDAKVIMEVYNITGQRVFELVNHEQSAGYYTVDFGAYKLSSGVYIYRLAAIDKAKGNNFSSIKKMMLLK
jgi:hypothetical protein